MNFTDMDYKIVNKELILDLIIQNNIDLSILDETQRINIIAISHIYCSSEQSIQFSDFAFEMMTDGLTNEMGLQAIIIEEVSLTNGRIYFDCQVFHLVKYICKVYDKKELAKLIYYQPTDNRMFELIIKCAIENLNLEEIIALRLATEICRFSVRELAVKSNMYLI